MGADYKQVLLWRLANQSLRDDCVYRNLFSIGAGATLDASGGKFGGGAFNGSASASTAYAQTGHSDRQRMASSDFYISAWVKPAGADTGSHQVILAKGASGSQQFYFKLASDYSTLAFHHTTTGSGGSDANVSGAVSITPGTWYHVAASRKSGTVRVFLDGTQLASGTLTGTFNSSTAPLTVGGYGVTSFNYPFKGLINDVQLIIGDYVHDASFTPETDYLTIPVLTAYARQPASYPKAGASRPIGSVVSLGRQANTHRIDYAGAYRIFGTVKLDDEPTDIPWKRRVHLFREPAMLPVAMTWSDPVTGAYSFDNISNRYKYTVLSVDYEQNYRAVVADNITPDLMP